MLNLRVDRFKDTRTNSLKKKKEDLEACTLLSLNEKKNHIIESQLSITTND